MEENQLLKGHNSLRSLFDFFGNYGFFLWRKNNTSSLKILLKNSQKGFTLVEIITVIGVMVILISAVLVTINPMEQIRKSQDSRRKNDLAQLQRVLENYYTDYGRYPEASGTSIAPKGVLKDWGTNWSPYIDLIPKDPSGDKTYAYWVDGSGQTYRIYTSLDRGAFDPQACTGANNLCSNADTSQGIYCSVDHGNASIVCNYGVTSSNTSP